MSVSEGQYFPFFSRSVRDFRGALRRRAALWSRASLGGWERRIRRHPIFKPLTPKNDEITKRYSRGRICCRQRSPPAHSWHRAREKSKSLESTDAVDYNELYKEAVADFNAGRNRDAELKFRKVLSRYPEHVQSRRYRALIRNRMRDLAAVPGDEAAPEPDHD